MYMAVGGNMSEIISLIQRVRAGDEDAFADIVALYTPMIQGLARKYSVEFDEVFSDACMALYRATVTYNTEQSDVTFGLYAKICTHRSICDYIRREDGDSCIDSDVDVEEVADTEDAADELLRREEGEIFRRDARGLLSEYEYRVLLMWLGGEKTADIAASLAVSAKSVDNAKARILKKLRDGLKPRGL